MASVQRVFETIGFARTSTSALDAARIGYLRDRDGVTMNRERLLADAKAQALVRAAGISPHASACGDPRRGRDRARDARPRYSSRVACRTNQRYDSVIGRKLAWILAGGSAKDATTLTEQQVLDLEREAFLSLCGERRTLERIAYTLKTGKPLRN